MGKKKIFNDPLYGLIQFPYDIIYQIIDHPYFQRLRRINQMGLANLVYPGAQHSRFQHSLGALHLCNKAIEILRSKGVDISEEEQKAVNIAILLHDIGHGPFSHALEGTIIKTSHENLSIEFIHYFEKHFDEDFTLVKKIFSNSYHREFLHQLIASQLDVDRMDYLNRDSFYTGVIEGKIGYDRILAMLNVVDDQLVVEEKGLYSVEMFLIARRFMYWQVYLHKTAVSAEQMLKLLINSVIANKKEIPELSKDHPLNLLLNDREKEQLDNVVKLELFAQLDDYDIWNLIKILSRDKDWTIGYIARSILNRNLFLTISQEMDFTCDFIDIIRQKVGVHLNVDENVAQSLIQITHESKNVYEEGKQQILILKKDQEVVSFSKISQFNFFKGIHSLKFLCYPRL